MKNKSLLIWGIIGFLYAFIPSIITLIFGGGNPWKLFLPLFPFIPSGMTFMLFMIIFGYSYRILGISIETITSLWWTSNIANIILWFFIGILIGFIITKIKKNG